MAIQFGKPYYFNASFMSKQLTLQEKTVMLNSLQFDIFGLSVNHRDFVKCQNNIEVLRVSQNVLYLQLYFILGFIVL